MIECSPQTSLDDLAHAILTVEVPPSQPSSALWSKQDSYFLHPPGFQAASRSSPSDNVLENRSIANVIIAKNLDDAPKQIQIQALELMQTKRIYTRTSVQKAPKRFLLIALLAGGEGPRLTKHLNSHMFISHYHDPDDGFANTEDGDDGDSISSVVKKTPRLETDPEPRISATVCTRYERLSIMY